MGVDLTARRQEAGPQDDEAVTGEEVDEAPPSKILLPHLSRGLVLHLRRKHQQSHEAQDGCWGKGEGGGGRRGGRRRGGGRKKGEGEIEERGGGRENVR